MKTLSPFLIFLVSIAFHSSSFGQTVPEVEWYPPEIEKSRMADRARVIISGRTQSSSRVQIDGESVTVMNKVTGPIAAKIDSRDTRANFEGFFEVTMELPQGLAQIPIKIVPNEKSQKTFMISVDVKIVKNKIDEVQISNTKVSRNKPPAAAKRIRLWAGAGGTYQSLNQSTSGSPTLEFQTM